MRWLVMIAVSTTATVATISCVKSGGGEARDETPSEQPTQQHDGAIATPKPKDDPVAVPSRPSAPSSFAVTSKEGLPADLAGVAPLWEAARHPTARRPESVARLYPDGRLYRYSDARRTEVKGMPGQEPAPKAWRLEARLSPRAVQAIKNLIRSSFAPLAATAPIATAGPHGRLYTWRANLDGEHVVVTPAAATDALPAAVRDIERAVQAGIVPGAVPLEQPKL